MTGCAVLYTSPYKLGSNGELYIRYHGRWDKIMKKKNKKKKEEDDDDGKERRRKAKRDEKAKKKKSPGTAKRGNQPQPCQTRL